MDPPKTLSLQQIQKYYSNPKVQSAILACAKDRESAGTFSDGGYSKRPDVLFYPTDILEKVKKGVVAFHCSVERWQNPMQLSSNLSKEELDGLRKGWDLIIDIDAKFKLEHGRAAAVEVVNFLKDFGISPTVKFSGRRGFHIAVSAEAFPQTIDFQPLAKKYPEALQAMCKFIKENCKDKIFEALVKEEGGVSALAKAVNLSEITPYVFVNVEEGLKQKSTPYVISEAEEGWSSRHMFRAPYSLHHKTWLVSLPLRAFKLKNFQTKFAEIPNINFSAPFLESKPEEGTELLLQALDWTAKLKPEKIVAVEKPRTKGNITDAIPEEFFPPCIKKIISGIPDGRKRSVFTLAAFLRSANWPWEKTEQRILEWNKNLPQPLPERFVRTTLKWHARQQREILPPNCENEQFMKSIGLCQGELHCAAGCKNPITEAFKNFVRARYEKIEGEKLKKEISRAGKKKK